MAVCLTRPRSSKASVIPHGATKMKQAFTLRFLFLIVTAAATMATALIGLRADELQMVGPGWLLISALVCGIVGGTLGFLVGLHDFRRRRGAPLGFFVGAVTGVIMSPLVFTNHEFAPRILAAQLIGAAMLVAIGLSARLEQK